MFLRFLNTRKEEYGPAGPNSGTTTVFCYISGYPLSNFTIAISNKPSLLETTLCNFRKDKLEVGSTVRFKCKETIRGRYVWIRMLRKKKKIALCEVQVFSTGNELK